LTVDSIYVLDGSLYCEDCAPEGAESYPVSQAEGDTPDNCETCHVPIGNPLTSDGVAYVIDAVRAYLGQLFAERTTRHGVLMDILGVGVLITGESGLGKSELGLVLVSRGHGLVADDAVDLYRISQTASTAAARSC
jgi:HPr kinase/phosphorylase